MGISMISNVFAELLSILYQSGIGIKYVEKFEHLQWISDGPYALCATDSLDKNKLANRQFHSMMFHVHIEWQITNENVFLSHVSTGVSIHP